MKKSEVDEKYIFRTFQLARKGAGSVSPNPLVGAVLVKNGKVIGEGYHRRYGEAHAEVHAIESARTSVRGATLYTNLEPCFFFDGKKTPPCVDLVIAEKIRRVVISNVDPHPGVSGKSIVQMKRKGIRVVTGVGESEGAELNKFFFHFVKTGHPYVLVKIAQTLDGRIATRSGESRWITGERSRKFVHQLRACYDAVLVGVGTVLADDPQLNVRSVKGRDPWRVIVDSHLRTPEDAKVVTDGNRSRTILATTKKGDVQKAGRFRKAGVHIWEIDEDGDGNVDLKKLIHRLGVMKIASLMVEGGATVFTSFLKEKLADELIAAWAPKVLGAGIDSIGDLDLKSLDRSIRLEQVRYKRFDDEMMITGKPVYHAGA